MSPSNECPCGIARVECEYHKPEAATAKPSSSGAAFTLAIIGGKHVYVNSTWTAYISTQPPALGRPPGPITTQLWPPSAHLTRDESGKSTSIGGAQYFVTSRQELIPILGDFVAPVWPYGSR